MASLKRQIGDLGEKIAANFLVKHSYTILEKNYLKRWGEIDIIAKSKEGELIFVEIKTRNVAVNNQLYYPEDAVNYLKQNKLIKTAETYLYERKISENTPWRIDVISIEMNKNTRTAKIKHFINAVNS